MATITIRVDDQTRDDLERLAQGRGTNVSTLIRHAIDGLLDRDSDDFRADVPRNMTLVQRRTLVLLNEILGRIAEDDREREHYEHRVEALEHGFTAEYDKEFAGIYPEWSLAECELVMDILDMATVLETSVAKLSDEDRAKLGDNALVLGFLGFDANDERELSMLVYARHLLATDRWTNLAEHFSDANDRGNSHAATLPTYQRMLPTFKTIQARKKKNRRSFVAPEAYLFNLGELQEVAEAREPLSTSRQW